MNARAWCLMVLRTIGLVLLCLSLPGLPDIVFSPLYLENYAGGALVALQAFLSNNHLWMLGLGLYFFFGGKWVARQITRGLAFPGMCPGCGYDIRGMEGGRCPECGVKIKASAR
ncbi:MAG: hypothetical protein IT437_02330 [Phycisphaerales bacterium]|nr:hypothetical protein [Phycisphaerales bacterium]